MYLIKGIIIYFSSFHTCEYIESTAWDCIYPTKEIQFLSKRNKLQVAYMLNENPEESSRQPYVTGFNVGLRKALQAWNKGLIS